MLLSERIETSPSDPELYLRRALIYSDTGEFKLAFADVDTAAQFGPVENTYFVRGILFYRLGQFDQALPLFNTYIQANPQNADALIYRARALRDAGQTAAALADYRRYIALNPSAGPGDYVTAAQLMVTLADRGDANISRRDALDLLDARINALGAAPQLQRFAIAIEQQSCHSEQVLERLNRLYSNARKAPQWHLQAAEQYLLLGQSEPAAVQLDAAGALLLDRRPTAIKAELLHRTRFLQELLRASDVDGESFNRVLQRYYPEGNAAEAAVAAHPHADDAPAHSHPSFGPAQTHSRPSGDVQRHSHDAGSLSGFQQPGAGTVAYEPNWKNSVKPFVRCYRSGLSGKS